MLPHLAAKWNHFQSPGSRCSSRSVTYRWASTLAPSRKCLRVLPCHETRGETMTLFENWLFPWYRRDAWMSVFLLHYTTSVLELIGDSRELKSHIVECWEQLTIEWIRAAITWWKKRLRQVIDSGSSEHLPLKWKNE